MNNTIDLVHPPIFNPNEWIGKGKIFDIKIIPQSVLDAHSATLVIPPTYLEHIPSPDLSVTDFLKTSLPTRSPTIVIVKVKHWFSHDLPDSDVSYLKTRSIPSANFLTELNKAFGQAWLDGAQSLVDPRYNDGKDRLPLWTMTWWRELTAAVCAQSAWRKSEEWLSKVSKTGEAAVTMAHAQDLFPAVPWKGNGGRSASVLEFTNLLGTGWITDELIDMMMAHLAHRARAQFHVKRVFIANSRLAEAIKGITPSGNTPPLLSKCQDQIVTLNYELLLFPAHVHGNHWVAVAIDFGKKSVAIGALDIYHDHISNDHPLLPWLHTSEPCEHAFANLRNIKKDFAMLDAYYAIPKLHAKLQEEVLRQRSPDFKARAQGYTITYFYDHTIDIPELSQYPSDIDIKEASQEAAHEAQSLLALCGISPALLMQTRSIMLPGINYFDAGMNISDDEQDVEESESELVVDFDAEADEECEAQQLDTLMKLAEDNDIPCTKSEQNKLLQLTFAAIALDTDEQQRM